MARPKKLYRESVGAYGHTVTVFERALGGPLYLMWWDPSRQHPSRGERGGHATRSLRHNDRDRALEQAREQSAAMLAAAKAAERGELTVIQAIGRYTEDVSRHKKGAQPREDQRRAAMWQVILGPFRDVRSIDVPTLNRFVRDRRGGRIKVPGFAFKASPTDRTIEADIVYLNAVLNHCTTVRTASGRRLLAENPVHGFDRPQNRNPKRPVATYDRYVKVREHADTVDPQRLFGAFFDLVESLGWRVSAICHLQASDYDPAEAETAPFGRLRKRGAVDKEGVDMWVPLSSDARAAIDRALGISKVVGNRYIFPAPKARHGMKPWSRYHARDLLERAELAAKIEHLEGGDFHVYRRKWATERKALPAKDVAETGGWRDLRSLERAYTHSDPQTMLAVVMSPMKLREQGSKK